MTRCIALLSSGLDSTVALALALENRVKVELALTFDYGQRAREKETEHAGLIANYFDIPFQVLTLDWFRNLSKSALNSDTAELPTPNLKALDDQRLSEKSAEAVWVPNRNGVFIEVAASIAEAKGFDKILVGFNKEEAATFEDNSEAYIQAVNESLSFSTRNQVEVFSPTVALNKAEIVREAQRLSLPLPLLWSCYDKKDLMCGKCESCMRLKRALAKNEVRFDSLFADQNLE